MLASLAHQSRSRQLLLPCFFAKQIPTMLHEHFDDTLLFSRVEIFCSSTKRGQNLDCRLKIWSAKSGGGKRCDVTCVHRPGLWRPSIFCTQLNSRWLWHILRNKASAKSILTRLLRGRLRLFDLGIDLYYTQERLNYSSFHAPFFGDWISSKRTKEEAFGLRGRRGRLPFPAVNLLPIHQSQRDMSMSD